MDDLALAAALADDLDAAFETLVRGHIDRCHTLALRISGSHHDAEEIAQEALVRAYRALAAYPADRVRAIRLRPWLAAIVVNLCRNRHRAARPAEVPLAVLMDAGGEPAAAQHDGPVASAERRDAAAHLAALLAGLPERYRVPVVLRHIDDLSYAELADVLGRPEGTLKAQVHRGLAMLRDAARAAGLEELLA